MKQITQAHVMSQTLTGKPREAHTEDAAIKARVVATDRVKRTLAFLISSTGLPIGDMTIDVGDSTIIWDSHTGEVRTVYIKIDA